MNLAIFESDDAQENRAQSLIEQWTNIAAQDAGRAGLVSLWRMLWRHFIAEEPAWVPSYACGQANSIWTRCVWTGKFLNPERKKLGIQKYPDTCARGLNGMLPPWLLKVSNYFSFTTIWNWLSSLIGE